jgi:hypothetical protein
MVSTNHRRPGESEDFQTVRGSAAAGLPGSQGESMLGSSGASEGERLDGGLRGF